MSTRRAILMAAVVAVAGFVGGVWFMASGWGFELVAAPPMPPPRPAMTPNPPPQRVPTSKAVGMPEWWRVSGGSVGLGPVAERLDLPPSPGCVWVVEPRALTPGRDWFRHDANHILIGVPSVDARTGRFCFYLNQLSRPGKPGLKLRVVLFDEAGRRYRSTTQSSGRASGGEMELESGRHDWEDLPPAAQLGPLLFGVEAVVPDADRLLAEAARAEAAARGLELPPPPRVGQPFPFDLATVDGRRVRAADFRGRATLLVFGGPDTRRPTSLKLLRREYPKEDLAVVGVSFSGDAEEAARDFGSLDEPVPLVLVPNDETSRRLWREGAEVSKLPAYWLLDRDGILHFQGHWFDLDDKVALALGRPTRRGKLEAANTARMAQFEAVRKAHGGRLPANMAISNGVVYELKPPPPGLGTVEQPMPVEPLPAPKAKAGPP